MKARVIIRSVWSGTFVSIVVAHVAAVIVNATFLLLLRLCCTVTTIDIGTDIVTRMRTTPVVVVVVVIVVIVVDATVFEVVAGER